MPRTPQPLHILRKDSLHLWPEILVVLLLFAAFAYAAPSNWASSQYALIATLVSWLLDVLMPISWLILISRLVHDEPLVGDRQFWTSRPYHWAKLLAAKILFLLLFVYLPFFLMQVFLLKHAGLYPSTALSSLLHNLLLLTVTLIVPIMALAAVTSTFARLLLSFLGAAIYVLIVFLFIGWTVWEKFTPPLLNPLLVSLLILLPAAALVFQYATRRTMISRVILAATPLLLAVLVLVLPYGPLIRSAYPASVASSDPRLSDDLPEQLKSKAPAEGNLLTFRNEASVQLPFAVSGVDKDSAYLVRGVSAHIVAAGVDWTSPFVSTGQPAEIAAGRPYSAVVVPIPLKVFNQIGSLPADVDLTLVTDHLKLDPAATWKAASPSFHVPSRGVCSFPGQEAAGGQPRDLNCLYALKAPQITFISAEVSPGSCANPNKLPAQASVGGTGTSLSFDPVITQPVSFRTGDPDPKHHYALCPGTLLNFLQAKDAGKLRLQVSLKQVAIANYAIHVPPAAGQRDTPQ